MTRVVCSVFEWCVVVSSDWLIVWPISDCYRVRLLWSPRVDPWRRGSAAEEMPKVGTSSQLGWFCLELGSSLVVTAITAWSRQRLSLEGVKTQSVYSLFCMEGGGLALLVGWLIYSLFACIGVGAGILFCMQ